MFLSLFFHKCVHCSNFTNAFADLKVHCAAYISSNFGMKYHYSVNAVDKCDKF
jgi:hypothetical protein